MGKILDFKAEWLMFKKFKATQQVLEKSGEYKSRGEKVVKPELINAWNNAVDQKLADQVNAWYWGITIEKALEVMEALSAGIAVEDVYEATISLKNLFGSNMNIAHNYNVACIVAIFHERGAEFCEYRNSQF